jgi:uncharacterized protein (DUF2336 family)
MSVFGSIIDELELALKSGTPGKRTEVLRQVTDLFAGGVEKFSEQQLALFDDVMNHLISHIESEALAELSTRLALVANAPAGVIRRLASDDSIEVAGPVLEHSAQLTDDELIELARTKGREHQLKIAGRSRVNEAITEMLIDRCEPDLANKVAANKGARFSPGSYSRLVMLADGDDRLTATLARRTDIPPGLFSQLLARATNAVRQSLLTSAPPEVKEGLKKILSEISGQIGAEVITKHYSAAEKLVRGFSQDTALTKRKLSEFIKDKKVEETVATLAVLSAVPIELVDRLMNATNPYGLMVLCKVTALYWGVARSAMLLRPRHQGQDAFDVDDLYDDYNNLSASSAQRLLRFWQARQAAPAAFQAAPAIQSDSTEKYLLPV